MSKRISITAIDLTTTRNQFVVVEFKNPSTELWVLRVQSLQLYASAFLFAPLEPVHAEAQHMHLTQPSAVALQLALTGLFSTLSYFVASGVTPK